VGGIFAGDDFGFDADLEAGMDVDVELESGFTEVELPEAATEFGPEKNDGDNMDDAVDVDLSV